MPEFTMWVEFTSINETVESIKRARAKMLRNCGESAYLILHRRVELQHEGQNCLCDPVIITQMDYRPSVYFAEQILNPVVH